jgi:hypothetical protein
MLLSTIYFNCAKFLKLCCSSTFNINALNSFYLFYNMLNCSVSDNYFTLLNSLSLLLSSSSFSLSLLLSSSFSLLLSSSSYSIIFPIISCVIYSFIFSNLSLSSSIAFKSSIFTCTAYYKVYNRSEIIEFAF